MLRSRLEVLRDEMVMHDQISALLEEEPRTIPELADAMGFPSNEVLLWVMAMWRYGKVEETGKADMDGFFHYKLKEAHS